VSNPDVDHLVLLVFLLLLLLLLLQDPCQW
jgi:hypothetical protein